MKQALISDLTTVLGIVTSATLSLAAAIAVPVLIITGRPVAGVAGYAAILFSVVLLPGGLISTRDRVRVFVVAVCGLAVAVLVRHMGPISL